MRACACARTYMHTRASSSGPISPRPLSHERRRSTTPHGSGLAGALPIAHLPTPSDGDRSLSSQGFCPPNARLLLLHTTGPTIVRSAHDRGRQARPAVGASQQEHAADAMQARPASACGFATALEPSAAAGGMDTRAAEPNSGGRLSTALGIAPTCALLRRPSQLSTTGSTRVSGSGPAMVVQGGSRQTAETAKDGSAGAGPQLGNHTASTECISKRAAKPYA